MSTSADRLPLLLSDLIVTLAGAVPARVRRTFLDLLLGAALTTAGHVTAAILRAGLSRSWTTYFWFLEYRRWSWLAVMAALLDLLVTRFTPSVWHVIIDDTLVERCSAQAPGAQIHFNHAAKSTTLPSRTDPDSCSGRAGSVWPRWSSAGGASVPCRCCCAWSAAGVRAASSPPLD